MFNEGDLVTPKNGKYYSDLNTGTGYKVLGVKENGNKIKLKGRWSTNWYSVSGFDLKEAARPAEPLNFVIVDYPNITSVKASAASYDKARTIVEGLLKKNPFGEFAILGIVDRAKLDFAPVRWSNDPKLSPPIETSIELNETSVYTPVAKGIAPGPIDTVIVGTLKERLQQRS